MFLAYDYNSKWDGKVDIPENLKPWVKSKREQNAFIEGQANERERINKLNAILIENNRYDDLKRSTTDVEFQAQLLAELLSYLFCFIMIINCLLIIQKFNYCKQIRILCVHIKGIRYISASM
jgi:hypothetical protein